MKLHLTNIKARTVKGDLEYEADLCIDSSKIGSVIETRSAGMNFVGVQPADWVLAVRLARGLPCPYNYETSVESFVISTIHKHLDDREQLQDAKKSEKAFKVAKETSQEVVRLMTTKKVRYILTKDPSKTIADALKKYGPEAVVEQIKEL